jgi:hypothetical protein
LQALDDLGDEGEAVAGLFTQRQKEISSQTFSLMTGFFFAAGLVLGFVFVLSRMGHLPLLRTAGNLRGRMDAAGLLLSGPGPCPAGSQHHRREIDFTISIMYTKSWLLASPNHDEFIGECLVKK